MATTMQSRVHQILGILFLTLAIISLVSAFIFFYNAFYDKGIFLLGYAFLDGLFAYGLWKRRLWLLLLSFITLGGIVTVKTFGFIAGITNETDFLTSVGSIAIFTGVIYSTRQALGGAFLNKPIAIAFLVVFIPVLLRSVGIL